MSDEASNDTTPQDSHVPLLRADFSFIVLSLSAQAELHLGLMGFGEEKPEPDLQLARHFIDLLGVLAEKTKGNLALDEQRLLENTLTELRFRFVQVSEQSRKPEAQKA